MSRTIECPSCALEIDAESDVCPYCGYDLPQQKTSRVWMAFLMIALMAWPVFQLISWLME
ncbi:MAG: zinc ribbon domain-containing protein [Bacteroidota bacterium]